MKIRNDYVSNSSSSSYVIVGQKIGGSDMEQFVLNLIQTNDELRKAVDNLTEGYDGLNEFLEDEDWGWADLIWQIQETLNVDIITDGYDGEVREMAIGFDPRSQGMKLSDDETFGQYKERVVERAKSIGIPLEYDKVQIITGGSDASGSEFIESCG